MILVVWSNNGFSCVCVFVCLYRRRHFPETPGLPTNAPHGLAAEAMCIAYSTVVTTFNGEDKL